MKNQSNDIRDAVRQNYSKVAEHYAVYSGCGCAPNSTSATIQAIKP